MVGIQSERVRRYLSSVARTLLWSCATTGEHTQRNWQVCLSDQRVSLFAWEIRGSLPFIWATSGSLLSVPKLQTLYCFFKSHAEIWTSSSLHVFFWLVIGTYILPFFPRKYVRTEISVTLSIGNKLYSSPSSFIFSFLWNHFVEVILRLHWIC